MKMRVLNFWPLIFAAMVLWFCTNFAVLERTYTSYVDQRLNVRVVFVDMLDMETGQRGYLISGDTAYLEPYEKSRLDIQRALDVADQTLPPKYKNDLKELRLLCTAKYIHMDQSISARRTSGHDAGDAVVMTGKGKQQMDQIRAIVDRLFAQIETDLAESRKDISQAINYLRLVAIGGLVLCTVANFIHLARRPKKKT